MLGAKRRACLPYISLQQLSFGSRWYHANAEVGNNRILSIWHRFPSRQDLFEEI